MPLKPAFSQIWNVERWMKTYERPLSILAGLYVPCKIFPDRRISRFPSLQLALAGPPPPFYSTIDLLALCRQQYIFIGYKAVENNVYYFVCELSLFHWPTVLSSTLKNIKKSDTSSFEEWQQKPVPGRVWPVSTDIEVTPAVLSDLLL
jgi:hypothetical protein